MGMGEMVEVALRFSPNAIDNRPGSWAENVGELGMTERWWPEAPIRKPLASSRLCKPLIVNQLFNFIHPI